MALNNWPPTKLEKRHQILTDTVHGTINLYHPIETLVDSKEFQRLRFLSQLGPTSYVYPSGTHTRFVHSLGTYHLAYKLVDSLRRANPEYGISSEDHLAVCVAALCHDLGHGPFSHLFDGPFRDGIGEQAMPKHEVLSVQLIRRLFAQPHVKAAFRPYLGRGNHFERNIQFICEMVKSEKFDEDNNWLPLGRGLDKSFLYSIVSNDFDSIDVDKWDYLQRDSLAAGVGISFNRMSVERLIENCYVVNDLERPQLKRLAWDEKVLSTLEEVGQGRQELHDRLYQHKAVRAIEALVVRAMQLASPHLLFKGDDNQLYPLSRVTENLGAFLRTDDSLLPNILNSTTDEMAEARQLLEMIERRNIPQRLDEEAYSPSKADTMLLINSDGVSFNECQNPYRQVEALVKTELLKRLAEYDIKESDIILITRVLHRGMGRVNPMEKVLLVDSNQNLRMLDRETILLNSAESSEIRKLGLYVHRDSQAADLIKETFDEVLMELGLRSTSRRVSPNSSQSSV